MRPFDTIVLLTSAGDVAALSDVLLRQRRQLDIRHAETRADLDGISEDTLARARLVGFVTDTIVPRRVLDALGYGAYNFHPGPPEYPGWAPAHFAIREGASRFGATAHVMAEHVDSGPIVNCSWFAVPPGAGAMQIEAMAFLESARLFLELAPLLACQSDPISALPIAWGARRCTRRHYAALFGDAPLSETPLDANAGRGEPMHAAG
jgi:hypothetical protein